MAAARARGGPAARCGGRQPPRAGSPDAGPVRLRPCAAGGGRAGRAPPGRAPSRAGPARDQEHCGARPGGLGAGRRCRADVRGPSPGTAPDPPRRRPGRCRRRSGPRGRAARRPPHVPGPFRRGRVRCPRRGRAWSAGVRPVCRRGRGAGGRGSGRPGNRGGSAPSAARAGKARPPPLSPLPPSAAPPARPDPHPDKISRSGRPSARARSGRPRPRRAVRRRRWPPAPRG